MRLNNIKKELVLAAHRAYNRGIQTGSGGNYSARVPGEDLMILKPSGGSFVDIKPRDLIITDFKGNLVKGKGKPTREAKLHGYIYSIAPEVNGVMHCHAPWAISWAVNRKPLVNITHHTGLKFDCAIDALDINAAVVDESDFSKVKTLFDNTKDLPAFLLVDHGIVAMGPDIITAEHNAELVEETAMIAVLKQLMGKL